MGFSTVQWPAQMRLAALLVCLAGLTSVVSAYELNPDSTGTISSRHGETLVYISAYDLPDSIKRIAKNMAEDMLSFYDGDKPGGTPGLLPKPPYYCKNYRLLSYNTSF
jgi:hypothetical protein